MKARIAAAFDTAEAYDRHAIVQREAAGLLARRITALALPPRPRVLEIGCGTGFLGQALADRLSDADWLATDIAPAMLERARARLADRRAFRFAVIDGEAPVIDDRFDLICANLAFQWFADLPGALARLRGLLAPGGMLAFTTLAEGSFAEWRSAHAAAGREPGTRDYPALPALQAMLPGGTVEPITLTERHATAAAFLRALKAIGAGVARPDHRPLSPVALRAVMRRFEEAGAIARYEVALCVAGRTDASCA